MKVPAVVIALQLAVASSASPCNDAMMTNCPGLRGQKATCVSCEQAHAAVLEKAGCGKLSHAKSSSKLSRYCRCNATGPCPGTLPPHPPPHVTPDCPHGPTMPCREPAQPRLESGLASSNLFWPGEQDANGTVFSCTYCASRR